MVVLSLIIPSMSFWSIVQSLSKEFQGLAQYSEYKMISGFHEIMNGWDVPHVSDSIAYLNILCWQV